MMEHASTNTAIATATPKSSSNSHKATTTTTTSQTAKTTATYIPTSEELTQAIKAIVDSNQDTKVRQKRERLRVFVGLDRFSHKKSFFRFTDPLVRVASAGPTPQGASHLECDAPSNHAMCRTSQPSRPVVVVQNLEGPLGASPRHGGQQSPSSRRCRRRCRLGLVHLDGFDAQWWQQILQEEEQDSQIFHQTTGQAHHDHSYSNDDQHHSILPLSFSVVALAQQIDHQL